MASVPSDNEIRRIFDIFDEEKSGHVETSNLPMLIRAFDQNPTQQDLYEYLADVDPNRTGYLDFADFTKALLQRWRDPTAEHQVLLSAFEMLDRQKTGFISVNQMKNILKSTGDGLSYDELDEFMALCQDSNFLTEKGMIDYREVCRFLSFTDKLAEIPPTQEEENEAPEKNDS